MMAMRFSNNSFKASDFCFFFLLCIHSGTTLVTLQEIVQRICPTFKKKKKNSKKRSRLQLFSMLPFIRKKKKTKTKKEKKVLNELPNILIPFRPGWFFFRLYFGYHCRNLTDNCFYNFFLFLFRTKTTVTHYNVIRHTHSFYVILLQSKYIYYLMGSFFNEKLTWNKG